MAFPSSLPLYLDDPPTSWSQQQQQQNNPVLHLQQQQQQPPQPQLVHDHHQDGPGSGSASTRPNSMAERARLAKIPQPEQALKCPRCESTNTKFCYFNNYSLSQPRHFCKACRRYWTRGGSLRSVPVGGSCRRNNKRSHSKSKPPSTAAAAAAPTSLPALPGAALQNMGLGFPGVQDMGVEQWRLNQLQQMYDFNELVKMEDNRGQFWGGEGSSSGGGGGGVGGGGGGGWMMNLSGFNSSSTGSLL